jgi:hypothetical protein
MMIQWLHRAPVVQLDRASAFEVGSAYYISAASGVAYIETRGATNLLNWTEVGPKLSSDHWGYAVMRASSDCLGDPKSATLRLTAEPPTSSELAGVGPNRRKSASCDETGRINFSFFIHLSFAFCHHSPLLLLRFYDGARSAPALGADRPTPTAPWSTLPSLCFQQFGESAFRSKLTPMA